MADIDSAVMQVPMYQAVESFRAYRALVKSTPPRATRDDVALYKALRAILRGGKVIDIALALRAGGFHPTGWPKLAVARADWDVVRCWPYAQHYRFTKRQRPWVSPGRSIEREFKGEVRVDLGRPPVWPASSSAKARVPMVPAVHRPSNHLRHYHLLWEADWTPDPPVDPMLLKHLEGPFYVVLAVWDLSPLEQAVLRAKL